jgi:hypothetical protein
MAESHQRSAGKLPVRVNGTVGNHILAALVVESTLGRLFFLHAFLRLFRYNDDKL